MGKVVDLEKYRKERERREKEAEDRRKRRASRIKESIAKKSGTEDPGSKVSVTEQTSGESGTPEDDPA